MKILLAAALCLTPGLAQAGDPCPISIDIRDLGAPDWLDHGTLLAGLASKDGVLGIVHGRDTDGLDLTEIVPGSAADQAGLRVGDVILRMDGRPTRVDGRVDSTLFDGLHGGQVLALDVRRGDAVTSLKLAVQPQDPLIGKIVDTLRMQECRRSNHYEASPDERADLLPRLFTTNRAFRCDDAHGALSVLGERWESRSVYVVRGSRRVLLTMPHWGTACVSAAAFDGDGLTTDAVLALIDEVAGDYVQWQIDHP